MTMGISVVVDTGRALMAAMQPLTGSRAAGYLVMRAEPGVVLEIPVNSYWCPIIDGQRNTAMLFKAVTGPNPGGGWTVNDSGTSVVGVMSNIGGARHNIPAGTMFQPADIPIDGLTRVGSGSPEAQADFEGAEDPPEYCGVKGMAVYETFDGPALTLDIHRSPLYQFPGVLLAFQNMEPADGVAIAQNNQMAVNAGDGKKFYKVTYSISVITTIADGDMARRQEGLYIADTITQLLNDKHSTDNGECLSNPGGVQVRQLIREDGSQAIYKKFYIYTVLVSAMTVIERLDFRTYNPWLRSVVCAVKPQLPELPNQGPITVVDDMVLDMTPDQLDFAIDGTFTRASAANLWLPPGVEQGAGELRAFGSGARRVTNAALGVMMEPALVNDLGAASQDLTVWVDSGGASVNADAEASPLGDVDADIVSFAADADSQLDFDVAVADPGVPVVISVFVKAPGLNSKSMFRIAAVDAAAVEHVSDDRLAGSVWDLHRFEVTPTMAGALTVRLKNASDGQARTVVMWGVQYSDSSRWGPEYVGPALKAQDVLTFMPPGNGTPNLVTPQVLTEGRWRLRFLAPDQVPSDVIGSATGAPVRTLMSIGDGVTDLFAMRLVGDPVTGGATLTLLTRGGGVVLTVPGIEWIPGGQLSITVDAAQGELQLAGTTTHDGDVQSFDPYAGDATPADFLTVGGGVTPGGSPAPMRYVALDTRYDPISGSFVLNDVLVDDFGLPILDDSGDFILFTG